MRRHWPSQITLGKSSLCESVTAALHALQRPRAAEAGAAAPGETTVKSDVPVYPALQRPRAAEAVVNIGDAQTGVNIILT